ncbi:ABC transporter ATP-binding protein [Sulfuricella sp.]|uniref:ABC transporter ATP-binding protein n=1 Tax=Sulfuricella sp. TaxID=2099377 RepID=UPI002B614FCA|nr:ABC transporter ATP-binding protein [Sulfuricella sp.]HUX62980.1 ABC transporter ATP-binding protein [Sulfuricella sp.]
MPSDEIAISVKNLTKKYRIFGHPGDRIKQALTLGRVRFHREFTALQDVSFEIKKGETVGIIGRNGSGKSTLLQLICGILKPTSGVVQVNGRVSALLELGAGFNPEFTGRENVYFQGAVMGLTKAEMDERFDSIVAFADIGEFVDQPVRTYSSGMYVRLAFAAAINVGPDILVVDEALSVGDAQFQAKCFGKFREFQEKGVTILFVTHSLDLVAAHCERVILLDCGRLVESGSPQVAIDNYRRLLATIQHQEPVSGSLGTGADTRRFWEGMFKPNLSEVRYGSRETEIIEAGLFTLDGRPTQLLHHGDECLVKIRVLSHRGNLRPFMSFVIKDLKGLPLCGTTTLMEDVHIESPQPGQILNIVFRLPMFLNPGHYLLSVGSQAFGLDGVSVAHDHRTDYLPFEVMGKPRYGVFAPPAVVSLEREC